MENSSTHSVVDLSVGDRLSLEHLLGGQLEESQQVFVVAFTPGMAPTQAERIKAASHLEQTLGKGAEHARSVSVDDVMIDDAVDAAMNEVRRRPNS